MFDMFKRLKGWRDKRLKGPGQADQGKRLIMTIGVDIGNEKIITVVGCLNEKDLCLRCLSEAIKLVLDYKKSPIIKPFMN